MSMNFDFSTEQGFKDFVRRQTAQPDFLMPAAFALGVATISRKTGKTLDVRFPWGVNVNESKGTAAVLDHVLHLGLQDGEDRLDDTRLLQAKNHFVWIKSAEGHPNLQAILDLIQFKQAIKPIPWAYRQPVSVVIHRLNNRPVDAADVYLRLHMLSMRRVQPGQINLDGAFNLLQRCAWLSSGGVVAADEVEDIQRQRLVFGEEPLAISHVDKFPRMLDYVVPSGVRIGDGSRVRLGAHLAEGTTVMHEGFVNFNAGTLGKAMVEGRISAGVVVGANSDVGGGASIMGTLSGGNEIKVSIGEGCLLEANSGLGIPIGDRVRVSAGHYIKGSSLVRFTLDSSLWEGNDLMTEIIAEYRGVLVFDSDESPVFGFVKASELAGVSDVIFRRNDRDGVSEVVPRGDSTWGSLNDSLHNND